MAADNNNIYEQVYNVREDDSITSRVALVICVLVERGLFIAGFDINKELLTIHYTGYNRNKPVWAIDFFEHIFASDPLLSVRERIKGIFTCSDKNMVIPDALYDEKEAKNWLKRIHFVEAKDVVEISHLDEDKANYLQAVPVHITELIKINFRKAASLPLSVYHFRNTQQKSLYLQCFITNDQVCATLHNYSQLLWHRVFSYASVEDIAYEVKHLCMENNISPSKITLMCNTISAAEFDVLNGLSQYFPGLRSGNGRSVRKNWDGAISLAEQLLSCVS